MTIGDFIDRYISDHTVTKDGLATAIGMPRTTFFSKLRGESEFSLSEGCALARELGVTVDELASIANGDVA